MTEFFTRLKQHHIYRVAAAYGAAIAVLIQIVARAFPYFGWSAAVPAVIIILIAGFPVALVLAWLLVKPTDPLRQTVWQKRHWKLGAVITPVVIAAVVVSSIYAFHLSERHAERVAEASLFNPPADTLVVLPFENLSGDPKQQYFSDGITEELTSALGQNPSLRVMAWETAARFRDSTQSPSAIGKQLNVADILNGSILREGDEVRVQVELVNTVTGQELWSSHYDEPFKNIFAVEDQVSKSIAGAIRVRFVQADLPQGGTTNPEAHELVLKGRALEYKFDAASLEAARNDFEQAIALDPRYSDAHAGLSSALTLLTNRAGLSLRSTLPRIRAEAEKALALDPRNTNAWVALGDADALSAPPHLAKARDDYRKALALDPSNAIAHLDYGEVLPLKPSLAEEKEATRLDPNNGAAWGNLAEDDQDLGDWEQDVAANQAMIRLDPAARVGGAFALAYAWQQLHQYGKMVAAFDGVKPATGVGHDVVTTGRLVYRAVADPALRPQALAALKTLSRHQSSQDVATNLIQMYASLGEHAAVLQLLETSCPAQPVGCSDLAVNPLYTALRGDPRFQKLVTKYNTVTME